MNTQQLIKRTYRADGVKIRRDADGAPSRTIEGYALVFDTRSRALGYDGRGEIFEVIAREAVTDEVLRASDIVMTVHHNPEKLLARSKYGEGTLTYEVDDHGLRFSFEAPATALGDEALALVETGVLDGCSFVAYIDPDTTTAEPDGDDMVYTVHRIERFVDFTLTNNPAYDATECTVTREAATPTANTINNPQNTPAMEKKSLTALVREGLNRTTGAFNINLIKREDAPAATPTDNTVKSGDVIAGGAEKVTFKGVIDDIQKGTVFDIQNLPLSHGNTGGFVWVGWSAASATIVGEKEAVAASALDITSITPRPERFAIRYDVSRESLYTSDNLVDTIVRKALSEGMRRAINNLMLSPSKLAGAASIAGPLVAAADASKLIKVGDTPTFKNLVKMKGKLLSAAIELNPVWTCHPATAAVLEATPKDAGSGIMLMEDDKICGYPVFQNVGIPEGYIALGDWSYQPSGFFGEISLTVDPYTLAAENAIRFILNIGFATTTLRTEAFVLGQLA